MTDHFANARRALRRVLAHSTAPNTDALKVARRYFDAMTGVTDTEFAGADPAFVARKVMLLLGTASDLADIDAVGILHQLAPEHTITAAEFADRGYMDVATFRALTAVITAREAAETFGLSRQAITQAIENGRLPARQTSGGGWLILRRDAEELWTQDRAVGD